MKKIIELVKHEPAYLSLLNGKQDIVVNQINDEALLLASAFLGTCQTTLVVKASHYEANLLYQELSKMIPNDVVFFGVDESFRVETIAASPEMLSERIACMYELSSSKPKIVISHVHALVRYVPTKEVFLDHCIHLKVGMTFDILSLQKKIVESGYHKTTKVDQPLHYTRRGGIIDIYSLQYEQPIRIEFFDDEIEDIRFFDATSKKTTSRVKDITILPASDVLYSTHQIPVLLDKIDELYNAYTLDQTYQDELTEIIEIDRENIKEHVSDFTIYKYLGLSKEATTIVSYMDRPKVILSNNEDIDFSYQNYVQENFYYYNDLQSIGKLLKGLSFYREYPTIDLFQPIQFKTFSTNPKDVVFQTHPIEIQFKNEELLVKQIKEYTRYNKLVFCLETSHQVRLLIELLESHQFKFTLIGLEDQIYEGINIYTGTIPTGIELVNQQVVFITGKELFPGTTTQKTKYIRYKEAKVLKDYQELHIGDYVVHDSHGIGQYLGIKTLEVQGNHKDYLYVSYAGDDTLYIPVEQFKQVRKYASSQGKVPQIHKLGGTQWQKTKQRIRAKVADIADMLIEIYATRLQQVGYSFPKDDELQMEFEASFGYELTRDQERSVLEMKEDMEKTQPMDRLLCGDVGFGKTEVALRGAFKAVLGGKQVAFLCPTTILSMQHYKTMMKRFDGFAVNVALLNRFTTRKQTKQILQDCKDGKVDILVGTHRILSKDVNFKDLGFLVIDEEQRFGVSQKEKIKEYRTLIDVLSLSATPIPRTLQMSLMNIRGLSTIETPPKDRMPVQTYVVEKNHQLIKQAILRELGRNGQVFYLYNRTSEINNVAYRIGLDIPEAKVIVGHGQMSKEELEDVMLRFTNKEFNVLVCTTIIETGIDIPNANTIIIEDADHFGLSQLYQIRGRVGRSNRSAYAYLLYHPNKQMNQEATKRLKAIKEFTELGSGYKIAMRDLSLRGAGDILGGQQAGFIDSIGFDMYMKILQDTIIEKTKGIKEEEIERKQAQIQVDGYIPHQYVEDDLEKLEIYQRLDQVITLEILEQLKDEFIDYYGTMPVPVQTLLDKKKLDILSNTKGIESIIEVNKTVEIVLDQTCSQQVDGVQLFQEVLQLWKDAKFKNVNQKITIIIKKKDDWLQKVLSFLQTTSALHSKE